MTNELKPVNCGCGGEAFSYNVVPKYAWWAVRCASCGIETTSYHTEAEAIESWNKTMGEHEEAKRTGTWLEDKTGNAFWVCSECGFVSEAFAADLLYHYCPRCGTEMKK